MSDLISRSAVLKKMDELIDFAYRNEDDDLHHTLVTVCSYIDEIPTLDAVPVVHAHWIKTLGSDGFVSTLRCSKCDNSENSTYIPGNFCWFCGAKMDGDSE